MESVPVRPKSSRDALRQKIKNKQNARSRKDKSEMKIPENTEDFMGMLQQVQNVLKTNPEMMNKISSVVNSMMSDPTIMNNIQESLKTETGQISSQTLESNCSGGSSDAVSKES
jgi:uridylate kinase